MIILPFEYDRKAQLIGIGTALVAIACDDVTVVRQHNPQTYDLGCAYSYNSVGSTTPIVRCSKKKIKPEY